MLTYWKKDSIAWVIIFWYIPNTLGGILQIALPWTNKAGLLVALYICNMVSSRVYSYLACLTSDTKIHSSASPGSPVLRGPLHPAPGTQR